MELSDESLQNLRQTRLARALGQAREQSQAGKELHGLHPGAGDEHVALRKPSDEALEEEEGTMTNETLERWRSEFQAITRSRESADRLVSLITAYTNRSLWTWEETAALTKRDLLKGKSIEEVIQWFANLV